MEHRLVSGIEKAFGWSGPDQLGKMFAHGSLPEPDVCAWLLTPTGLLDLVMRRSLAPHRLRCLVNGADVHPQDYFTTSEARRGHTMQMADMHRIGQLMQAGCTLVLNETNVYDPTMEVTCRALQWWAHELVQVNVYLTTGEAAGFDLHWDDHDVLVVQLAGEKSWEVRGLSRPAPMYRDAEPNPTPPDEVVWAGAMQAGDVMHIPRGYWHQATREDRGDGFSLHATFGLTKRTGVHWLSWLADQARADELFRHDLDRWNEDDKQQHAEQLALVDDAVRLVATRSIGEFLVARERVQPVARHVSTHGVFGPLSSVVCVSEFPPELVDKGERLVVRAAGKEITFAEPARAAIRLLLSGVPVAIAEVTAAAGVDAGELADVFVAEDICAEVTPELLDGYRGLVTSEGP